MNKIPHFAGVQQLSLTDLQALADAVEAQTRILPPAGLPGRVGSRKYGLANFNLDTANSCDGSAWPENEGLIRSVGYSEEDEPYICQGDIALPMAHYVPGADDESPAATGVLHSVLVEGGITAPDIQRGQIRLPLADSACGGSVAGLVQGVQMDSSSGAYITQGVLHLPTGGGGCSCVPAEYDGCEGVSTLGLIRSIDPNDNILMPDIVDGSIRLPYADTARGAQGIMQGVEVVEGFTNPLICFGHLFLPLADTCSGATGLINGVATDATTSPYIAAGVLHLPSGGGGCSCVPAEYDGCEGVSTLGLIRSIAPNDNILIPDVVDGAIRLPYADTVRGAKGLMYGVRVVEGFPEPLICYGDLYIPLANTAVCNGAVGLIAGIEQCAGLTSPMICAGVITIPAATAQVAGLRDMYGNPIAWEDLYTSGAQQTSLAQFTAGGTTLTLCANFSAGYLNFEFRA